MRFVIILFFFLLANARSELQRQEQQNKQHLDPLNDSETQEDHKQQMKRTLIGLGPYTYAANYGAAKHVGVHPLGFKYLLGYGPVGYVPVAKPAVTVLKPVLHTHGWKPVIPVQTVPIVRPLHLKPIVPIVPVHAKPHFVHQIQPVDKPVQEPVLPQIPTLVKPALQPSFVYPFYKPLVPLHTPFVPVQPPLAQPVVPQVHIQPPVLQPAFSQPVHPGIAPQIPVQQPLIPQHFLPQPVLPLQTPLYHFIKQFPQIPFFKHITPLFPVHIPAQVPSPELPKPLLPPVTIHTPATHDTGVSVQIPSHLPDHPNFRPTVNVIPQIPFRPDFDEQGGQGQSPFGIFPQPPPDFHTDQQGETDTPFVLPQHPHVPTHPAPQTPLYLPPHPVFRPAVPNPVGPVEPTNSVQTELSATYPKYPFASGIQHPSITLEPPYGSAHHLG